jgi:hypothetical protein
VITATREVETGRSRLKSSPGTKVLEILSTNKLCVHTCNPRYAGGIGKRIKAQD